MATRVKIRVQFDPDLPLFAVVVKNHLVEIYFHGTKESGKIWQLQVDGEIYDFIELHECWIKAEELLGPQLDLKLDFVYPREKP